jgi:hypothetical protein
VKFFVFLLSLICTLGLTARSAQAQSDEAAFQEAVTALQSGAFSVAIERLEQLSDRGLVRASISQNRALAYLQRAESPKRRPGDLGQAVAALKETLLLDPGNEAAQRSLPEVTLEISRQRARKGLDPVVVEPPLSYALFDLLPVNFWAWGTLLGTLSCSVGLLLLRNPARPLRLSGQIGSVTGLLLLLVCAGFSWAAADQRRTQRPAVVVVPEAALLDASGSHQTAKALGVDTTSIPEGASVVVTRNDGRLLEVGWGTFRAWVLASQVRVLPVQ